MSLRRLPSRVKFFSALQSKRILDAFTVHLAHELGGAKMKSELGPPGWVRKELGGLAVPLGISEPLELLHVLT